MIGRIHQRLKRNNQVEARVADFSQREQVLIAAFEQAQIGQRRQCGPLLGKARTRIDADDFGGAMLGKVARLLAGSAAHIEHAAALKIAAHAQLRGPLDEPIGSNMWGRSVDGSQRVPKPCASLAGHGLSIAAVFKANG